MNHLRVTWQPKTRRLLVTLVNQSNSTPAQEILDSTKLTEALWAEYSTAVTQRFQRVFPEAVLETVNLPREVVELHLLVDLYRPEAFPALLAERLARQICAHFHHPNPASPVQRVCLVTLSPLAGELTRLIPALEQELQQQSRPSQKNQPSGRSSARTNFTAWFKCWAGAGVGVAATTFNLIRLWLRGGRCVSSNELLPENLFVLFSGHGNHTRHLWNWLNSAPRAATILVLGQYELEPELAQRAATKRIPVFYFWRLADLPRSLYQLLTHWGSLSRLTQRAAADLCLPLGIRFHARAAAWWWRGWGHAAAAARLNVATRGNTVAHFGLVAHADSRLANLALRQQGIRTIHWLHGIVEDSLHYRAHCTACLCQNPVDADLRSAYGSYTHCLTPALDLESIPRHANPDHAASPGVLVVTNLLHPDNRFANAGAAEALDQLLRLVAAHFSGDRAALLTWRPHPREKATARFSEFQKLATELGFTINNSTLLDEQVRQHRQVITTFSGSIGEVAAAGAVPAVFAGLPYETQGHWGRLPTEIKFRTAAELDQVLNQPRSETGSIRLRDQLCAQYHQPAPGPEAIRRALEEFRAVSVHQPLNPVHSCPKVTSC